MRTLIFVILSFLVSMNPISVFAADVDGRSCDFNGANLASCARLFDRYPIGTRIPDAVDFHLIGQYTGFIDGVALTSLGARWCISQNFSMEMLYAITSKFLRENPQEWAGRPVELVIKPLAIAFPCKK